MNRVILVRYGEIYLKGKNRKFFENLLQNNIKNAVSRFNCEVLKIPGRFMISGYSEENEQKILNLLVAQAGVFSVSPALYIETNFEEIKNISIKLLKEEEGTFKVVVNRADKTFSPSSMELARTLGGEILKSNKNLKVDVVKPQIVLNIDIRENKRTFIFTKTLEGIGGMPVSSAGSGLLLLSGGIDSPVAGYMMAKRGTKIHALHFHSFPYTSELARLKVEELAEKLAKYNAGELEIYMCKMTHYQEEINKNTKEAYNITLLRRAMFKIAEKLCKEKGFKMIITGESLGQVASQTIESMTAVGDIVDGVQIMRPLIAFDKQDTIEIARKIDTYDISIRPYEDCCTIFVPKNPIIKPRLENVLKEEAKLNFDALIDEAYSSIEKVTIKAK